ncbi:MAG: hypothetical protein HQK54_09735 [Oligoflexales bacterium]|nr:hypothetical protein [Oligoflexales bacterium]
MSRAFLTGFSLKSKIGAKLLKLVFGFYLIVTVIVTVTQLAFEYINSKNAIKQDLADLGNTFAPGLAESLWQLNVGQLRSTVDGILKIPAIKGVVIYDEGKNAIVYVGETKVDSNSMRGMYEVITPITYLNSKKAAKITTVGYCSLFSDNVTAIQRVQYSITFIIVNAVIKTIALWVIFLFFAHRVVANPLNSLTRLAQGIDPENPAKDQLNDDLRDKLCSYRDEVGLLSKSFFAMGSSLLHKIEKIKDLNHNLESKVRQRTKEVALLVRNLPQGIFAIDNDLKILTEYSDFLEDIFEKKQLAGENAISLLFDDSNFNTGQIDMIRERIFTVIGENAVTWELNKSLFPSTVFKKINGNQKELIIDWAPIVTNNHIVEKFIISVMDFTERRQAETNARKREEETMHMTQILAIPPRKFDIFVTSIMKVISQFITLFDKESPGEMQVDRNDILLNLHTLKSCAMIYGFHALSGAIHECENLIKDPVESQETYRPMVNDKAYHCLSQLDVLKCINNKLDRGDLTKFEAIIHPLEQMVREIQTKNLKQHFDRDYDAVFITITKLAKIELKEILMPILNSLPNMALQCAIPCPTYKIVGEDLYINKKMESLMEGVFVHIIRNSLVHGFIDGRTGNIIITTHSGIDEYLIRYRDSGIGLNISDLRKNSIDAGLLMPTASDAEVAEMIFHYGFSTHNSVTPFSGRGVGMNAAYNMLKAIGGSIQVILDPEEKLGDEFRKFSLLIKIPDTASEARKELLSPHAA